MRDDALTTLLFRKMHGLGNDFVVLDRRGGGGPVPAALARAMGDRHRGVGFDQMAVIEDDAEAHARLTFLNADGSEAGACGNATRCVARLLMDEAGVGAVTLRTARGLLACEDAGSGRSAGDGPSAGGGSSGGDTSEDHGGADGDRGAGPEPTAARAPAAVGAPTAERDVRVNMGVPLLGWREVPLAEPADTLRLPLPGEPVACSMGNPHCTFVVPDAEAADLAALGRFEAHRLFPERTNVQAVSVHGDRLRVRVWERGVGVTLASGSSACAAAVACARRGLSGRSVRVDLDGGSLRIDWRGDGVWMTGPTAHVFDGLWWLS